MKSFSAIFKVRHVLGTALIFFAWWGYKNIKRRLEVAHFFSKKYPDSAFLENYVDKKIEFCKATWVIPSLNFPNDLKSWYSPSKRFRVIGNHENPYQFDVYETSNNDLLAEFPFEMAAVDPKWSLDENYLIFLVTIDMGDDWDTPYIYILDLKSGSSMHFAVSNSQTCW